MVSRMSTELKIENEIYRNAAGNHRTVAKVKKGAIMFSTIVREINGMLRDVSEVDTAENRPSGAHPGSGSVPSQRQPPTAMMAQDSATESSSGGTAQSSGQVNKGLLSEIAKRDAAKENASSAAARAVPDKSANKEQTTQPKAEAVDDFSDPSDESNAEGSDDEDAEEIDRTPAPETQDISIPQSRPPQRHASQPTGQQDREITIHFPPWMTGRPTCSVCSRVITGNLWFRCRECPQFYMDEQCFMQTQQTRGPHSPNHRCTAWEDFMIIPLHRFLPPRAYLHPNGPVERQNGGFWTIRLSGGTYRGNTAFFGIDAVPPGHYGMSFSILYQAAEAMRPSQNCGKCSIIIGRPREPSSFIQARPTDSSRSAREVAQLFSSYNIVHWNITTPAAIPENRMWHANYRPNTENITVAVDGVVAMAVCWEDLPDIEGVAIPLLATILKFRSVYRFSL